MLVVFSGAPVMCVGKDRETDRMSRWSISDTAHLDYGELQSCKNSEFHANGQMSKLKINRNLHVHFLFQINVQLRFQVKARQVMPSSNC